MPSIPPQFTSPASRVTLDSTLAPTTARASSGLSGAANRIASGLARSLAPDPVQLALSHPGAPNRAASQTHLDGGRPSASRGEAGRLAAKRAAFNRPHLKRAEEKIRLLAYAFSARREPVGQKPLADLVNVIKSPGDADYSKKIVSSLKSLLLDARNLHGEEMLGVFEMHVSDLCDSLDVITPLIKKTIVAYTAGCGMEVVVDPNTDGMKAWVDKFTRKISLKTGVLPQTGLQPSPVQKKQIMNAWIGFAGEVEDRNHSEYGALRTRILLEDLALRGGNGAVSASEVYNQHAAVCRELSLLGAVVFAEFGIPSRIGSGNVGTKTDDPGPHVWIETLDSRGDLEHIVDTNCVKDVCDSFNAYEIMASGVEPKAGHEGSQCTVTYTQNKFFDLVKTAMDTGARANRPGLVRQTPMRNLLDLDNLNLAGDEPVPASDIEQFEDNFFQGLQKSYQDSYLSTIEECTTQLVKMVVDTNLTGEFNLDSVQKMVDSADPALSGRVSVEEVTDLVLRIRSDAGLNPEQKTAMELWVKDICDSLDAIDPQFSQKLTAQGKHALNELQVPLRNETDRRTQVQSIETFTKKMATMTGIYPAPGQSLTTQQRNEIFSAWLDVSAEVKNSHNLEYGELRNAFVDAEARRMNVKLGAVADVSSFDPAYSRGLSVIGSVVLAEFGIASRLGSGDIHNAGELKREHCWIETLTDEGGVKQLDSIVDSYAVDRNEVASHQTPVEQQVVADFVLSRLYEKACKVL